MKVAAKYKKQWLTLFVNEAVVSFSCARVMDFATVASVYRI